MLYRTIVADPPWDYGRDNSSPSITHGGKGKQQKKPFAYPTMSVRDICALRITEFAEDDCRLFLWTTNRHLPMAFGVAQSWGFDYRQTITWRKTGNPSPFGGSIAPVHAEFLLVCTAGNPPVMDRIPSSVVDAPAAIFGHSQKPEVFLDIAERVSSGPYLELFARRQRLGWDTWGNEALCHVEIVTPRPPSSASN